MEDIIQSSIDHLLHRDDYFPRATGITVYYVAWSNLFGWEVHLSGEHDHHLSSFILCQATHRCDLHIIELRCPILAIAMSVQMRTHGFLCKKRKAYDKYENESHATGYSGWKEWR
jgi:hypothetical protein